MEVRITVVGPEWMRAPESPEFEEKLSHLACLYIRRGSGFNNEKEIESTEEEIRRMIIGATLKDLKAERKEFRRELKWLKRYRSDLETVIGWERKKEELARILVPLEYELADVLAELEKRGMADYPKPRSGYTHELRRTLLRIGAVKSSGEAEELAALILRRYGLEEAIRKTSAGYPAKLLEFPPNGREFAEELKRTESEADTLLKCIRYLREVEESVKTEGPRLIKYRIERT